jgi:hypothetical protein
MSFCLLYMPLSQIENGYGSWIMVRGISGQEIEAEKFQEICKYEGVVVIDSSEGRNRVIKQ